jgi:hypothetical protein
MSFLPALAILRLALDPMGHSVAGEVANSQASKGIETVRADQAHYIKWCYVKHILDTVGSDSGWQVVLENCVKYLMTGVNCLNKDSVRSATCKGYAIDASILFTLRNLSSQFDFSDESNWTRSSIHNLECEETIARQKKAT